MRPIALPIDNHLKTCLDSLSQHSSLIISAEPGAGKTTRLPIALLASTDKQVWVLEPRRIAATAAAQRIASEQEWSLGVEVGYQVRFENKSSSSTKLLFLTEALLLRRMLRDPQLSKVGCVVLDEFHERSLSTDLALGALKELQSLERPDLKIIVMSATLEAQSLSSYLENAPIIKVPGKTFPIKISLQERPQLLKTDMNFINHMHKLIERATRETSGNVLCFLPGRGEIERLLERLHDFGQQNQIDLYPLHASLNLIDQQHVLSVSDRRKIILSTNVAESSLTVPGVRCVVDSGLHRQLRQDIKTGLESLTLTRISKASATQRAGRAAREADGRVYQAWNQFDVQSQEDFERPEIFRSDLSETVMLLAALGVHQPETFSWFEPPPTRALHRAREFLLSMGALCADGSLTDLGKKIQKLPLEPRAAKLLIMASELGFGFWACEWVALLSEGTSRSSAQVSGAENDLWLRYQELKKAPLRFRSVKRAAQQLGDLLPFSKKPIPENEDVVNEWLLDAFTDRLCRRRKSLQSEAKMVGGRGVKLHAQSSVQTSEYFLSLEMSQTNDQSNTLVFQAVGLSNSLINKKILPLAQLQTRLEWDREKEIFMRTEAREFQGLTIGPVTSRPARPEEIKDHLFEAVLPQWEKLLERNDNLKRWFARCRFLNRAKPTFCLLGPEQIREALEQACYGEVSLAAVERKNLVRFFQAQLSVEQQSFLDKECPQHWTVPSGSRLPIEYSEEQGAHVEVRLQELFGLEQTPKIAGEPLTLFLLAPNYRPVQVTRDLQSFWSNGYVEVRKELRARYPKHSWPDNPLTTPPQAKGRPRR